MLNSELSPRQRRVSGRDKVNHCTKRICCIPEVGLNTDLFFIGNRPMCVHAIGKRCFYTTICKIILDGLRGTCIMVLLLIRRYYD
jgi:hypothetical protein